VDAFVKIDDLSLALGLLFDARYLSGDYQPNPTRWKAKKMDALVTLTESINVSTFRLIYPIPLKPS